MKKLLLFIRILVPVGLLASCQQNPDSQNQPDLWWNGPTSPCEFTISPGQIVITEINVHLPTSQDSNPEDDVFFRAVGDTFDPNLIYVTGLPHGCADTEGLRVGDQVEVSFETRPTGDCGGPPNSRYFELDATHCGDSSYIFVGKTPSPSSSPSPSPSI